jgi:hypothetical protein
MEDYIYIQNMPLVRSLREENEQYRAKNKELKKKNKELNRLVKLVLSNLDLLKEPMARKAENKVKVKVEPKCAPYTPESIGDDIEILEPNTNEIISLILEDHEELEGDEEEEEEEGDEEEEEEEGDNGGDSPVEEDRFVKCDKCQVSVDCHKNSIHIAYKGEPDNLIDEKTLCTMCFHEQEDVLIEQGYNCDDWSIEEEEEVEEEGDNGAVEEEEEEEEGDNGGDPPVEGDNGGDPPVEEDNGGDSSVEEDDGAVDDDDDEVEEVIIKGKTYYTTSTTDGLIYEADEEGEISVEVGKYEKGKVVFYKK